MEHQLPLPAARHPGPHWPRPPADSQPPAPMCHRLPPPWQCKAPSPPALTAPLQHAGPNASCSYSSSSGVSSAASSQPHAVRVARDDPDLRNDVSAAHGLLASMLAPASYEQLWDHLQELRKGRQAPRQQGQQKEHQRQQGQQQPSPSTSYIPGLDRELVGAVKVLASERMERLTGSELVNLKWSLTCLGHHDPKFFDSITEALYSKLNDLDCRELAMLIWTQAVTGQYDHEVFASLTEFVWEQCRHASPHQLAVVAACYASFQHFDDDQDFFDALATSFLRQLHASSLSDIALMLKSLAVLQLNPGTNATLPGEQDAVATASAAASATASAAASALGSATASALGSAMSTYGSGPTTFGASTSTSTSSSSSSRADRLFPLVCQFLDFKLHDRLFVASPAELADVLWACAWVGHYDKGLLDAAAQRLHAAAVSATGGPEGSAVGRASGAAADDGGRRPQQQGHNVSSSSLPSQEGNGFAHLEGRGREEDGHAVPVARNCVLAGGLLSQDLRQHNPALPPARGQRLADGSAGGTGRLTDPEILTKVLWAYTSLRHWHSGLVTLLLQDVGQLRPERLTWVQAARLGAAHSTIMEITPGTSSVPCHKTLAEKAWRHVSSVWPSRLRIPDTLLPRALVELQRMDMYEDDLAKYQSWKYRPSKDLTRSALIRSVLSALEASGRQATGSSTYDGVLTPHIALNLGDKGGACLAVEVLDPSSCMRNEPHPPIGPVASRHRSLRFRGWKVLTVPFYEWLALAGDKQAQATYLEGRIRAAEEASRSKGRLGMERHKAGWV